MTKRTIFFLISAQHFIPTGGIGSFFRGFQRMARSLDWKVICVLDKKPIGQGRHMMEAHKDVQYAWANEPQSYNDHGSRFDPETVNEFKVDNFQQAFESALTQHRPDLILINTLEASIAVHRTMQATGNWGSVRTIFYTHHENFVVPAEQRSRVFSHQYNEALFDQANTPGIEIATQNQFNIERMNQVGFPFAHDPLVLPMPLPDLELLEPYEGKQEGVLFIGRHEPRKNPKLFAKAVAEAGLPAKVLTNKRGMKKFEKTLAEAGVESFDIRYELTGSQKTDFIKSARIAFHPANLESYGFSAMETLAAGLPTVLIEEYRWWRAFEHAGVITAPKDGIVQTLADLHHSPDFQSKFDWLKHENKFQEDWLTLLS